MCTAVQGVYRTLTTAGNNLRTTEHSTHCAVATAGNSLRAAVQSIDCTSTATAYNLTATVHCTDQTCASPHDILLTTVYSLYHAITTNSNDLCSAAHIDYRGAAALEYILLAVQHSNDRTDGI